MPEQLTLVLTSQAGPLHQVDTGEVTNCASMKKMKQITAPVHLNMHIDGRSRRGQSKSESHPHWQQGFRMNLRLAWVGRDLKAHPVAGPPPMNADILRNN